MTNYNPHYVTDEQIFERGHIDLRNFASGLFQTTILRSGAHAYDNIRRAIGRGCAFSTPCFPPHRDMYDLWTTVFSPNQVFYISDAKKLLPVWDGLVVNAQQQQSVSYTPIPASPNLIDAALAKHKRAVLGQGPLNSGSGNPFDYKRLPKRIEIRNGSTIFKESKW